MTCFGEALRNWRKQNGWTQVELAKRLSTTQAYVCNLEKRAFPPYGPIMDKLSQLGFVYERGNQNINLTDKHTSGIIVCNPQPEVDDEEWESKNFDIGEGEFRYL